MKPAPMVLSYTTLLGQQLYSWRPYVAVCLALDGNKSTLDVIKVDGWKCWLDDQSPITDESLI